ncbi:hypothetical protein GGC65_001347 [Sphingopyxis sp. OAS728]|uniref:hypothetical protein n=1 Tax=Sphingopyxis sp. OAS728 TaxID=2663823 RepID=UPI00178A3119|nr:hypothetical protein [Sphingopyxis sp. OAS728]MBE1526891.1 hypothetical protein [Sphingopyxis sp. OAS728]
MLSLKCDSFRLFKRRMSNRPERFGPEPGKAAQVAEQQVPSGQHFVKHPSFSGDLYVAAEQVCRNFVTLIEHDPLYLSQWEMRKKLCVDISHASPQNRPAGAGQFEGSKEPAARSGGVL